MMSGLLPCNCLVQGQNNRFVPCQLGDSIQKPFGYWPYALTTRLPATLSVTRTVVVALKTIFLPQMHSEQWSYASMLIRIHPSLLHEHSSERE